MRYLLLDRWVITPCQELAVTKRLGQRQVIRNDDIISSEGKYGKG
jgi:hypothetical protein